jgi:hypothetical protein
MNGHANGQGNGHVNGNGSYPPGREYVEMDQIVHHLSEVDQAQLQRWIAEAVCDVPQQVQVLGG